MSTINFLSNPVVDALGWTLLHAIWQGFLLVLATIIVLHLLNNRSSALRYSVSVSMLLTQVLLSVVTFIWYYSPASHSPVHSALNFSGGYSTQVKWQTVAQTLPWPQQMQQFLEAHLSQFVLIYIIGVVLFGLRLAGGWLYLRRLSRTAQQPNTIAWEHLADRLRSTMLISMSIRVRESARIAIPMVVGVIKPVLLLPIGLTTHLTTYEIEAVLAHELAHVKRHDYVINLLQSVVEVLYFFHPALWWLSARVREEREHCCDDLAIQACGGDGRILAQALARIEELRLIQLNQTPALAMAFASKRQELLHRVRRMLGVPTRPFVSNGSLAGLTLATILLMSISVYAIQKQDDPKGKVSQPKPAQSTLRHRSGNGTEFSLTGGQKVDYVVWKGQRLPAKRIARLQHYFNDVMAGKLSLDNVAQPDRDILLTIIETNQSFDKGMNSLAEGLSHIDYSNIVATAMNNVPLSPDGTVEGLAKVDYSGIIQDALTSIPKSFHQSSDTLQKQRAYHQRQMDSLSQLMEQRSRQMRNIHLQMEKMQFPIEELQRNADVLNWRKDKLMEQRNALIDKHQRLLQNNGKQKISTAEIEKQLEALQPEIKKLESSMEELDKKVESLNAKQEDNKLPINKLEREAEQLDEQMEKLSEEMSKHGERLEHIMPDLSDLDVNVNVDTHFDNSNRNIRVPRPPRPARVPRVAPAAIPAAPPVPAAKPATVRTKVSAVPTVKPVIAPKPERPE